MHLEQQHVHALAEVRVRARVRLKVRRRRRLRVRLRLRVRITWQRASIAGGTASYSAPSMSTLATTYRGAAGSRCVPGEGER